MARKSKKQYRIGQYSSDIKRKTNAKGVALSNTQAAYRSGYLAAVQDDAETHKYVKARYAGYNKGEAKRIAKKNRPEELRGITSEVVFKRGGKKLTRNDK